MYVCNINTWSVQEHLSPPYKHNLVYLILFYRSEPKWVKHIVLHVNGRFGLLFRRQWTFNSAILDNPQPYFGTSSSLCVNISASCSVSCPHFLASGLFSTHLLLLHRPKPLLPQMSLEDFCRHDFKDLYLKLNWKPVLKARFVCCNKTVCLFCIHIFF